MKRVLLFCIFSICLTACKTLPDTIPVTSVTISQPTAEMIEGETVQLKAIVQPDNATDKTVTWSSSDATIASVDQNGKVTALSGGTVTIKASSGEKYATCSVNVTVPVNSIILDTTSVTLKQNQTVQLSATVGPDDATDKSVMWRSSDSLVARVDSNGKVTALQEGATTITATAGEKTATCIITVSNNTSGGVEGFGEEEWN